MISFEWPWAFALAVLPALAQRLLPRATIAGAVALPIAAELERVAGRPSPARSFASRLPLAAWLLLVAAAAQPTWTGSPLPLPVFARDLVLAMDLSASMRETDIDPARPDRSRLDAAKQLAAEFLLRREGDRVGLVVFGSQAYLYAPLTLDRGSVAALVADVEPGMAGDATAIGDAIVAGIKGMAGAAAPRRVLILLTDGENTAGSVPPQKAAELAAAAGVRVYTIGFGAETHSSPVLEMLGLQDPPLPVGPLKGIARTTHARYFRARTAGELNDIYELIDRIEPTPGDPEVFQAVRSLFHWPLSAAVVLAAIFFGRRVAWR